MRTSSESVRQLFRSHGLRHTRQREVLYNALSATRDHPTAEELWQLVKPANSGVSLSTVYNTLEALTDCGLCRRIPSQSGGGPCRYDADVTNPVHLVRNDGRLDDVPDPLARSLIERLTKEVLADVERQTGVHIDRVVIQLFERRRDER